MLLTRALTLKIEATSLKADTARYTHTRFLQWTNRMAGQLFFNGGKTVSTEGQGQLVNKAQHKARGIISALRAAQKKTKEKANVPVIKSIGCPAKLEVSRVKRFDYWLIVENEWQKKGGVALPCKSHKRLNGFLRDGWHIKETSCELVYNFGRPYARVYVQKEVEKALPQKKWLGVDVGYRNGAIRSDGYVGENTSRIIKKQRERTAERQRQKHPYKRIKSVLKQVLDREVKRAVSRAQRGLKNLAVESPNVLANLKSGKLHGWSRAYFANRARDVGQEKGVFVWAVNPAYTSILCRRCGKIDKQNRAGSRFECVACGHVAHADIQAAKTIADRARASYARFA